MVNKKASCPDLEREAFCSDVLCGMNVSERA